MRLTNDFPYSTPDRPGYLFRVRRYEGQPGESPVVICTEFSTVEEPEDGQDWSEPRQQLEKELGDARWIWQEGNPVWDWEEFGDEDGELSRQTVEALVGQPV